MSTSVLKTISDAREGVEQNNISNFNVREGLLNKRKEEEENETQKQRQQPSVESKQHVSG